MVKKLLISGCSYGVVYSDINNELKEIFKVDEIINLSQQGASPDRQIRVVIEWIAQNGNPDMVIMPVSHFNRFDLPIAEKFDPLHNLHYGSVWQMDPFARSESNINSLIDKDTLKTFLKTGAMINKIEHPAHDYLFVKLITFQAFLELNKIRHLIFDTGNYYEKLWMEYLSIDNEGNSGYQPGMKKRSLIENCKGIYKLFSFCSNVWMYEQLTDDEKKDYIPWDSQKPLKYPFNEKATIHHQKEMVIKLMKHLKQEGAVYG